VNHTVDPPPLLQRSAQKSSRRFNLHSDLFTHGPCNTPKAHTKSSFSYLKAPPLFNISLTTNSSGVALTRRRRQLPQLGHSLSPPPTITSNAVNVQPIHDSNSIQTTLSETATNEVNFPRPHTFI